MGTTRCLQRTAVLAVGAFMLDVVFLIAGVVFFTLTAAYGEACNKL